MKPITRWVLIVVAGLVLLALPTIARVYWQGYNLRPYQPPAIATAAIAATPIPTPTPAGIPSPVPLLQSELKRGPIVVDLAHYSLIDRNKFQPLAAALATRGLDLQFWLPTVDTTDIEKITDFPDLSVELGKRLVDASGLLVISPFFLYTPAEIAVVEKFVADGGRLFLVSDPDLESDAARDTNQLATAFNVVFNEDYLYDTVANDENFTYFFQGDYFDRAKALAGSDIAFYGGRSIGGAVVPQVRSASTTLSSLRNGLTNFNTVALGGLVANGSTGRVLAMSDFDVLTDPFVARHDNRRMLAFVADFLAGAQRDDTLVDFPAFLDKQVALVVDNTDPVGAAALSKAAELQRALESSGRSLTLAPNTWLSDPKAGAGEDLIYLAGYQAAGSQTTLLSDLGITLVEEVITPTVTATTTPVAPPASALPAVTPEPTAAITATPAISPTLAAPVVTATPAPGAPLPLDVTPVTRTMPVTTTAAGGAPVDGTQAVTPTAELTETAGISATATISEAAAPAAVPTVEVKRYLERTDGVRLVADETQIFIQRPYNQFQHMLAVVGNSEQAIGAGLTRLLARDFAGCLMQEELVICPYAEGASASPATTASATLTPAATPSTPADPAATPDPVAPASNGKATILLIDDNKDAGEGEKSEAAIYLTALTAAGNQVDLWNTENQGIPDAQDLTPYKWVIWSDASYTSSGIDGDALRVISSHINEGGHLTISSRMPFFGVSGKPASPIKDVIVVADGVAALVEGLPDTPITLSAASPPLTPLDAAQEPAANAQHALARGPASEAAGAPVLVLLNDDNFEEPKGALLMLFGMSVGWLPTEVSTQLIHNMAQVMLQE